jgi:hypothetical protein
MHEQKSMNKQLKLASRFNSIYYYESLPIDMILSQFHTSPIIATYSH